MVKGKNPVVFFDFDNTITTFDVMDDMLGRFSKNKKWLEIEERWKAGKIGSLECLKGQVEGIAITKFELDKYLAGIKIDRSFKKLIGLLKKKRIKTFILSDNFGYILKKVLANNGIDGLPIYANRLTISGNRLKTGFPLTDKKCGDCAHCKKTSLLKNVPRGATSVYVGDGRSDACASQEADIVFAKGYLEGYYRKKALAFVPFKSLGDVYNYIKENVL